MRYKNEGDKESVTLMRAFKNNFSYWVCLGYSVTMFMLIFGVEALPKENRILQSRRAYYQLPCWF